MVRYVFSLSFSLLCQRNISNSLCDVCASIVLLSAHKLFAVVAIKIAVFSSLPRTSYLQQR